MAGDPYLMHFQPPLSQLAVSDRFHYNVCVDQVQTFFITDQHAGVADLIDQARGPVGCVQDRFQSVLIKNRNVTSGSFQFCTDVGTSFFLCQTLKVIIHDDPLTERFMDPQVQRIVELWKTCQKNDSAVL